MQMNRDLRQRRAALLDEVWKFTHQPGGYKNEREQRHVDKLLNEAEVLNTQIAELEGLGGTGTMSTSTGVNIRDNGMTPAMRTESKERRDAFRAYLAGGMTAAQQSLMAEFRDMGSGGQAAYPGASSGFFVPVGFVQEVNDQLKYFGPMLDGGAGMPRILDTATGQPMPWPCADDTSQVGELIGENQQVSTQDVSLSQVTLGAYKFSTKLVKVSIELLQDSAFDLESFLIQEFSRRIGRIVNTKCTIGAGTTEPYGIIPSIVAGGNIVTAVGAGTNDGTSAANTIGSDDLTTLEHAVDIVYRPGAKYMMHDSTLKAIKKVKDKYGRPLWQESTRDGQPATINGYQYAVNNDMDQLQAGASSPTVTKNVLCFGALDKFIVRRVRQLSVLRLQDRFADYGQVAFIGFARYDSNSLDTSHRALAVMKTVY
jgi:HK97 family phage major capsid protein